MNVVSKVQHDKSSIVANPWLSHAVRIESVQQEIPGVATYDLSFLDPVVGQQYQFSPGQFNMLYLPGVGEVAISISADPAATRQWAHTIRVAGGVTQTLARMQPGETLGLRGPYGAAWPVNRCVGKDVVVVAGGIGLAPLRPAIYRILQNRSLFGQLTLLIGSRTPEGFLYANEYNSWSAGGFDVQVTVDHATEGWAGSVGVVTLLLDRLKLPRPDATMMLTCGPEVMMHYAAKSAQHRGLMPEQVWLSTERNMQCAVGLCGHCQLGPKFICKDGPVFRLDEIAPYLQVEGL